MKPFIFVSILVLSISQITIFSMIGVVYDSWSSMNTSQAQYNILSNTPVVFQGNNSVNLYKIYSPEIHIENSTISDSSLVANGIWLQTDGNRTIEHQMLVYDYSYNQITYDSINRWLSNLRPTTTPLGFKVMGIITQIDHHEPQGLLETRTEVLKLIENNNEYDWYDVTVTQSLTPGANYTSSSWEWNWLQYTMNGSLSSSNIYLSDYDTPSNEELTEGPFNFLWKLLRFDLRKYIPWLFPPEPIVIGIDTSDFSLELFRVRFEAQRRYRYKDKPLEKRHHYVIRIEEGKSPIFWHQTQVQYTQAEDYAQIPYITPPLASGYIVSYWKR